MKKQRWQDWTNVLLGAYLVLLPFFGIGVIGGVAATNSFVVGTAVVLFALAAITRLEVWEEYTNVVLGLWLVAAPFVLNFTNLADSTWNQVIVGVLIAGIAFDVILKMPPKSKIGHGDHKGHGHA